MSTPPAPADVILSQPRPVLFLDTCALLDIVRAPYRKELGEDTIDAALKLRERLGESPPAYHAAGSTILGTEFAHNVVAVERELLGAIEAGTRIVAVQNLIEALAPPVPDFSNLRDRLVALANDLLGRVLLIPEDQSCIGRAFARVLERRAPAVKNNSVKDAYLIEQCLALCRELRSRGFGERIVFCSSNPDDFSDPRAPKRFHPDIAAEAVAVGLEYFPSLRAAVGSLGATLRNAT